MSCFGLLWGASRQIRTSWHGCSSRSHPCVLEQAPLICFRVGFLRCLGSSGLHGAAPWMGLSHVRAGASTGLPAGVAGPAQAAVPAGMEGPACMRCMHLCITPLTQTCTNGGRIPARASLTARQVRPCMSHTLAASSVCLCMGQLAGKDGNAT